MKIKPKTIRSTVEMDDTTRSVSSAFDYDFKGESIFEIPEIRLPDDFCLGAIIGPSGSGKSSILSEIGASDSPGWYRGVSVCSHFGSADRAVEMLQAVGLMSVPSWVRPYHVLSTGERHRADLARALKDGACIDEFTSTVDRTTAMSVSRCVSRYARNKALKRVVVASCHEDILPWLQPDWVYYTAPQRFSARGWQRPRLEINIEPCSHEEWAAFAAHHYLTHKINRSARCWIATHDGAVLGFASAISFPNGNFKNGWREHRTVVLPEWQGLGIGPRLSDAVAASFVEDGCRYFSKTTHPRMGEYRESSPRWKPTSKNRKSRPDYSTSSGTKEDGHKMRHTDRVAYSHEYIGI